MNFRQVAVEIGAENFTTGIQAVAAQPVLQFRTLQARVVQLQPKASLLAALVTVDFYEFLAQFRRAE